MQFGFELLDGLLDLLELALPLRAGALRFLVRIEELLDSAIEVREVEPHRRQENHGVKNEREEPAPYRATMHLVQQTIVLLREAMDLFEKRPMIRGHALDSNTFSKGLF